MEESYSPPQKVSYSQTGMPAPKSMYQDILFTVLYIVHLIVIFALLVVGGVKLNSVVSNATTTPTPPAVSTFATATTTESSVSYNMTGQDYGFIAAVVTILILLASFIAWVWLTLCKHFPYQMIIATLIANVSLWVIGGIICFAVGNIGGGVVCLIIAVILGIVFFFWRARIPFAAAVLNFTTSTLKRYPGIISNAFLMAFVSLCWYILWGCAFVFSFFWITGDAGNTVASIFFIFSFYWSLQVIRNLQHVTSAGVYATWYFLGGQNNSMPPNPTLGSMKRAWTYSFGSICLGSLIVALIQTARALVRGSRGWCGCLACILNLILGCIEAIIKYFNKYAFTYVAIYGKSFCESAKDTLNMFRSCGCEAIINDGLLSGILSVGCLLCGVICGLVGALIAYAFFSNSMFVVVLVVITAIFGVFIGFGIMSVVLSTVDSGIATTFVCFVMDPDALFRNDPELHRLFLTTYNLQGPYWQPNAGGAPPAYQKQ